MREGEPKFEEDVIGQTDKLLELDEAVAKKEPSLSELSEPFLVGKVLKGGEFSIREIINDPDKIVRTDSMVGSVEETMAHYEHIKDRFEAMRNDYGINIPDITNVSIGKNENGKDCVFMVVDKIEGKDLGELKSLPATEKDNFDNFYTNFLQSTFDAYKSEKPFFCDIKTGNIMYGHKSKEKGTKDDFFLSDVGGGGFNENGFIEFQSQHIEVEYNQSFFRSMINAKSDIQSFEKKFGENVVLNGIKGKLEEIYEFCKTNRKQELEALFSKDPTAEDNFK